MKPSIHPTSPHQAGVAVSIDEKAQRKFHRGFTLIELMITAAIIAILASVALPSYQQYVIRSNRAAAQAEMMDIANRQQQFFLANRSYATTLATLGYSLPDELSGRYTAGITTDNAATPPNFTVTFTPIGAQASDGPTPLTLNNQGLKAPAEKW
jgi:type IV pilus assembly protein PilE